jgi:hypothetical protein
MKVLQFRSIGPVTLVDCSAEEVVRLAEAVSNERSKIKYLIMVHAKRGEDGKRNVSFCAQAFEKLTSTMWMKQLGLAESRAGADHHVFRASIAPSVKLVDAIKEMRNEKGCAEFGKAPPVSAGAHQQSLGISAGAGDGESSHDSQEEEMGELEGLKRGVSVAAEEMMVDESLDSPSKKSKNACPGIGERSWSNLQKIPMFGGVYYFPLDCPWEEKVRLLVEMRMHGLKPARELAVEDVWSELYKESLVWCKEQVPYKERGWVYPSRDHQKYVAQAMYSHPLANEEWRAFAGKMV